ncbi:tripartite motif-containing protein 2-like [Mizuhopecten yessoensis]|uniref:E3 ubiquitin-protein ligase TRIM56 n=1 Tax=Mizuhopecten yessoensis TaxID=6573 RepID=A0A210PH75_MIZYE|nr:tripartite motif-containing protein 2-like [Mizuhopecten yessoensis]OWF35830.1 E3 ubiquitin-protein ligase TRIM56 [Mizuhopecten yessoensis]
MAKNASQTGEKILVCGLCSNWFKKPRTLTCLHSYCDNCLSKHILSSVSRGEVTNRSATSSMTKEFNCPLCDKVITHDSFSKLPPNQWVNEFPVNKFLLDLLDIEKLKRGDKSCGPCSRNGEESTITSWCKECRDGLCDNCAKVHKGMRVSMEHTVLTRADYMKQMDLLKEYQEPCRKHAGKTLDMYCMFERELCCPNCVAEEHRKCEKVVPVAEAAIKIRTEREPAFLSDSLEQYIKHIERTMTDRNNHTKKLEDTKKSLTEDFANIRIQIINMLDNMEKSAKKELTLIHGDEIAQIQKEVKKCKSMKEAVSNAQVLLKMAEEHGSDSRLMNTLEMIRKECFWYEEDMGKLRTKLQDCDYDFEKDHTIDNLRRTVKQLGKISVKHVPSKLPPFPNIVTFDRVEQLKMNKSTLSLRGRRIELLRTFEGKQEDDNAECWHTGAAFLGDGKLALVDRQNKKLKIYNKSYRVQHTFPLSSKPWDVTLVSSNEIAVTLPEEYAIMLLVVDDEITQSDYFSTDERCYGITFARGKFFTLCYDGAPPALKIIGSDGKEIAAISQDDFGSPLFSRPIYVTSNSSGTMIYITDERRGSITTLTETKQYYFNYSCLEVSHAAGIAVDQAGNLYVCRNHAKSVQLVSPDGERLKTLVARDKISYPRAIAYDPTDERLVVTQGDKSAVKVFQFMAS